METVLRRPRCHLRRDVNVGLMFLRHRDREDRRAGTKHATVILYGSTLRRCYAPLVPTSIFGDVAAASLPRDRLAILF